MIPLPCRLAAIAGAVATVFALGYANGYTHEKNAWALADGVRAKAEAQAVEDRQAENERIAQQQAAQSANIQRKHDEEIAGVRATLAAAGRMRVPAWCRGAAAAPDTASAGSSNGTDSGAGLLPERVDADIRALILSAEEAAATGRAAQAFIRENGMSQ